MPVHLQSGFTASISILHIPDPVHDPMQQPVYLVLQEMGVSTGPGTFEATSFVRGESKQPFRVYFERNLLLRPITEELEVYVALLYIDDDESPFAKAMGCGAGIPQAGPHEWFLEGHFAESLPGHSVDLEGCLKTRILLSLHVATLKPGVVLGNGKFPISDVDWSSDEPIARMQWHYLLKPELVPLLGLDQAEPKLDSPTTYARSSTESSEQAGAENLEPVTAFLRRTNGVLVSMLTAEQKLQFLTTIANSHTVISMVSPATRTELQTTIARLAIQQQQQQQRQQASCSSPQTPAPTNLPSNLELSNASSRASSATVSASGTSGSSLLPPGVQQTAARSTRSKRAASGASSGTSVSVLSMRSPSRPSPACTSPRKKTRTTVSGEGSPATQVEQV